MILPAAAGMEVLMKFQKILIGIAVIFVLVLGACAPQDAVTDPNGAAVNEAEYQGLLVELEAEGAQVEQVGIVEEPTIGVDTRQVNVNGFPVQVVIFPDEEQPANCTGSTGTAAQPDPGDGSG
jgi:hypothetical protein